MVRYKPFLCRWAFLSGAGPNDEVARLPSRYDHVNLWRIMPFGSNDVLVHLSSPHNSDISTAGSFKFSENKIGTKTLLNLKLVQDTAVSQVLFSNGPLSLFK